MKTTPWITLGALIGSSLIVSAQDEAKRPQGPHGSPPPEIVKQFDEDGDGKLSESERKAMGEARRAKMEERRQEMIAKFDKDGDGKLNEDERAQAMESRKAEVLKRFDTDGDGTLSKEERAKIPRRPGGPGAKQRRGRPGGAGSPGAPAGEALVE